ncbi:DUF262 domain-containing protein [Candidatus Saccharibacteria bacterium]|nr:DUF262 domain-containing protein [Candidatus Saccharibacteria bacterium]
MSNKTFDPLDQNISTLFSVADAIYVIPNYQRQYSWGNEQLEELWSDLLDAFQDNPKKEYFLGSIVAVDDQDGHHDLVDGQQRITTLMIMLNVILKTFPDLNSDQSEAKIQSASAGIIKNMIFYNSQFSRLKLQVRSNFDTDFNTEIIKRERYDDLTPVSRADLKKDQPLFKFRNTAYFFYKNFTEFRDEHGQKALEDFVNYIIYKVYVIKILCTDKSFAIKLFLILNDRGLELSSSDIIKSYILDHASSEDEVRGDEYLSKKFESNWNNIEDTCNSLGLKVDDFFSFYEYYKLESYPKEEMTDELEKVFKESNIEDIIDEIKNFATALDSVYQNSSPVALSLRYVGWRVHVISAMTTAYMVNYENKEALFEELRRFLYLSWISGTTLNSTKQTLFNVIKAIGQKDDFTEIKKTLEKFIKSHSLIRKTYEALKDDVYNEDFLKPLLFSVEYNIREEVNEAFYPDDKTIHMDHILPRKFYEKPDEWPGVELKRLENYLNKLGNMALLFWTKNEEALNHGMSTKIDIYKGHDKRETGLVTFATTRKVIDDYETRPPLAPGEDASEYEIARIEARAKYLTSEIEKLLRISQDDIKDETDQES